MHVQAATSAGPPSFRITEIVSKGNVICYMDSYNEYIHLFSTTLRSTTLNNVKGSLEEPKLHETILGNKPSLLYKTHTLHIEESLIFFDLSFSCRRGFLADLDRATLTMFFVASPQFLDSPFSYEAPIHFYLVRDSAEDLNLQTPIKRGRIVYKEDPNTFHFTVSQITSPKPFGEMRKKALTLLCLVLTIISFSRHSHCKTHATTLDADPMPPNSPTNFSHLFPKRTPIPPSGPSLMHNNIGS
ncbi:hypothetical protein TEA_012435 [Camellia sinensis var. sinensis]|uniref:Uncharacterized protein n=1 Tax=Camellia sinensis var. sinensis TaxID=542762 RepID=A0A4S4EQP2_CAMSN|nr:hypothetical protein TEA_012435 [Camellia sinensis var. sinensis]